MKEDLYIRQAEKRGKGQKMQNICHQPTLRFVLEDCYNLMPSHQNSMPNKTNRDIMIQQFRAVKTLHTASHRITSGQPIEGLCTTSAYYRSLLVIPVSQLQAIASRLPT